MECLRNNISQFIIKDMQYKINSNKLNEYKNDLLPFYAILRSIPNKLKFLAVCLNSTVCLKVL